VNERTHICIVGGDSAIGRALRDHLIAQGLSPLVSSRRRTAEQNGFFLDMEHSSVEALFRDCDVVVLVAAITRLADCRTHPGLARRVNVEAPIELAKRAFDHGATVIFLSTNQVFDGSLPSVAPENPLSPRSVYGKLKAEAENGLRALGGSLAVVRLGKVVGPNLALFETWETELAAGRTVRAFDDLKMAPIAIGKVAHGLERIASRRATGTFHLGCLEEISYADAARHLALRLGADPACVLKALAAESGIPDEERPAHVSLAPGQTVALTGFECNVARAELDVGLGFEPWAPA